MGTLYYVLFYIVTLNGLRTCLIAACVKSTTSFIPLSALQMYVLALCFRFIQTLKYVALYIFCHFANSQPGAITNIVSALVSLSSSSDTLITHTLLMLYLVFSLCSDGTTLDTFTTPLRVH